MRILKKSTILELSKLRKMLSEEDRVLLDSISEQMAEHGFDEEFSMYTPYAVFLLGMSFAVDQQVKLVGNDLVFKSMED